jgi:NADPH-dependent glutamate synthase beta subunit-like oxidoreductase/ferredoxin
MKPIRGARDLPEIAISQTDMGWNSTGTWRYQRPVHVERRPPCGAGCPAGEPVREWIRLARDGSIEEAWRAIVAANPFPAVCGRVCYHVCESRCNRAGLDEPVAIHHLERVVGDEGIRLGLSLSAPGAEPGRRNEKVAVVGSGPAGLSCAVFLARAGYAVTVLEAAEEPGGMLRVAIPRYRLPREVLDAEIQRVRDLGVEIRCGRRLGEDLSLEDLSGWDAVFLATGAHHSRSLGVPGEAAPGVRPGLAFLRELAAGEEGPELRRVVVVGGGNTAIDCARSALRLGAACTLLYRRSREEMPAHPEEIAAAEAEGVEMLYLAAPLEVRGEGRLELLCQRMELGPAGEDGRRRPVPIDGDTFALEGVDAVLTAIGEQAHPETLAPERALPVSGGLLRVDGWGRTPLPRVFAGGDAATGAGTVVDAIASGQRAAQAIRSHLEGGDLPAEEGAEDAPIEADGLNLDYFERSPASPPPELEGERRLAGFEEVVGSLGEEGFRRELGRCFVCGTCDQCDVCWTFCPEPAVAGALRDYAVDYQHCKGCGICAVECPRGALTLELERAPSSGEGR